MAVRKIAIDSPLKRIALIAAAILLIVGAAAVTKWGLGNAISTHATSVEMAELAAAMAPADPQTHFAASVLRERSFEPADVSAALREMETATALSPNNYLLWLRLAKMQEAAGNRDAAERSLRRALELAPNYSSVQWALGNLLLRQGATAAGFDHMRAAAAGDPSLSEALVHIAWQFADGDPERIRTTAGRAPAVVSALAVRLADTGMLDEARESWKELSPAQRLEFDAAGKKILGKLFDAKKFRAAADLSNYVGEASGAAVGVIHNGGFESGVKMDTAANFEWQLAPGGQPQIALTDGQKRSGSYSLLMIFRPPGGMEFRQISQTVAVEPGGTYLLDAHYRSDLKGAAKLRWQVASAVDGKVLASSDAAVAAAEWQGLRAQFTVPNGIDGVVIRLIREECPLPSCSLSGNFWLDDVSITRQ